MRAWGLILFFICAPLLGTAKIIDTAVNNLGPAYNTSFPQLVITGLKYPSRFGLTNGTAVSICCSLSGPNATTPPTSDDFCALPGTVKLYDFAPTNFGVAYCRALSGTLSTASFEVEFW